MVKGFLKDESNGNVKTKSLSNVSVLYIQKKNKDKLKRNGKKEADRLNWTIMKAGKEQRMEVKAQETSLQRGKTEIQTEGNLISLLLFK